MQNSLNIGQLNDYLFHFGYVTRTYGNILILPTVKIWASQTWPVQKNDRRGLAPREPMGSNKSWTVIAWELGMDNNLEK